MYFKIILHLFFVIMHLLQFCPGAGTEPLNETAAAVPVLPAIKTHLYFLVLKVALGRSVLHWQDGPGFNTK